MTRIATPHLTFEQSVESILRRTFADLVAQTHALFESRGVAPTLVAPDFIVFHLEAGRTPLEVVHIALGNGYRKPARQRDGHPGGTR